MTRETTSDPASNSALSRETILRAFEALSSELGQRGVVGEVCLFGGTVMVLAFTARLTTKDVDALFQPAQPIREIARRIATEQNLPEDWLNDGAKGFLSARHETTTGNLPQFPHLRLTMPVPEYLLAMRPKSLAQVAELARQGDAFDRCLANFLDEFYARPNAAALAAPPILLAPEHGDLGRVRDAYLAATAEELARARNLFVSANALTRA